MRVRVVAGIVVLPILPLVLFFAPGWVLPLAIALISAVGVYELLGATGFVQKKRMLIYGMSLAAIIPVWFYFNPPKFLHDRMFFAVTGLFVYVIILFAEAVIDHKNVGFHTICAIFFTGLVIPLFFSSLVRIAEMDNGRHVVLIPFVLALLGDTCAYFFGRAFGKRKLKPDVSPNKTVEGAIGGVAGVMAGMVVYGLIEQFVFGNTVHYHLMLLYGLLGSVAGQLGDLSMSLIKREFHIKDFGNIMPGHGGVMDRLDSVLFTAPLTEILLVLLPAITIN